MADNRPIGVFDSGLGGLTVVKELLRTLPNENIIYFGDTGRVPYGTRSREIIKKYAAQDEKFLLSFDVKLIVAACGTVSSVAYEEGQLLPVPFVEVVTNSVNAAVKATKSGRIGVIGTTATCKSGSHASRIKKLMPDAEVFSVPCPLFVPLVEEGWVNADDPIVLSTVGRYLKPLMDADVDTLILGCTHYPILLPAIRKIMGDGVSLINMGEAVTGKVSDILKSAGLENDGTEKPRRMFYVSDKTPTFSSVASLLLGDAINENDIREVDINKV